MRRLIWSTWQGRGSSSWESTSRRRGGRPRLRGRQWGSPSPSPIPRTLRPERREAHHFGAARPAFRASAQNSSSVTPRCLSDRSRNDATKACWSALDRPSAKRSEEHTSELQSLITISYAVFCLKKKKTKLRKNKLSNIHIRNNIRKKKKKL